MLNDKLVEGWRWCGESSGQEDDDLGKIVWSKNTIIKFTISNYTQTRSVT